MILFENGTGYYGGNNRFCYGEQYVAEDFLLQSDSVITKVNLIISENDGVTAPLEKIEYKIYLDSGGGVGSEVFSGNVTEFTRVYHSYLGWYTRYKYSFDLHNISLIQGIYWLGLRAFPSQWEFHWDIPTSGSYRGVSLSGNNEGDPSSYGPPDGSDFNHVFSIEGPTFDVSFTATPTNGIPNTVFIFTDTSTGGPISWQWSFGDGSTSTEQNPTHLYESPGVYTVSLTATNLSGSSTETKIDYITVVAPTISVLRTPDLAVDPSDIHSYYAVRSEDGFFSVLENKGASVSYPSHMQNNVSIGFSRKKGPTL